MSHRILIAPAGWEERYVQGVFRDIDQFQPTHVVIPFSLGYEGRTATNRAKIKAYAERSAIAYEEAGVDYCDAISLFRSLWALFEKYLSQADAVRLNVTTTPRDVIWNILHFFSLFRMPTEFSYYRPKSYGEYLSRDAQAPRLVLKRSGISFPDRPTCILALDGFDTERRSQLRNRYEPKVVLVGKQVGVQLDNAKRNASNVLEHFENEEYFDFDCYDTSPESLAILEERLSPYLDEYNVIAASLGPKPSALTLFNLNRKHQDIGLVYIPAGDYSERYSTGFDEDNVHLSVIVW